MHDRIWFACPYCAGRLGAQSEAGSRTLRDYSCLEVPAEIASDIEGSYVHCGRCGIPFKIVYLAEPPRVFAMGLA